MSETYREVELRLVIADPLALEAALQRAGARFLGQGLIRTTAFDFPDRRLRAARRTLRLREDWTGLTLTAKEPVSSGSGENAGQVKQRNETNLALRPDAAASAVRLLHLIGLQETLSYEKERRSWALGGGRIDVDVLADGGECYAEIEAAADEIAALRAQLDLDAAPVETRSYFEIVRQARARKG